MTPDMASLMAALPHIMAAPKDAGRVRQLCFRPARHARSFPDQLSLTRAAGIPGDRWLTEPWLRLPDGTADPDIQVSILPARVLDLVWQPGDDVPHPGDPIIADMDMSHANMPAGTLLLAGTAVLRVSSVFNDGCVKWKTRYGADAKEWITAPGHPALRLRGIFCAVEQDGVVRRGDVLTRLA
jgi:hypothetical protein